jgi:hypothetical protein
MAGRLNVFVVGSLGIEKHRIESIWGPVVQKTTLGIPEKHLGRHAFHRIQVKDVLEFY